MAYKDWLESQKLERELLRQFFRRVGIEDYRLTDPQSYSVVDGFFAYKGKEYPVEAKCRHYNRETLKTAYNDKLLIEYKKFNNLLAVSECGHAVYCNFLTSGEVYWFYLPKSTPKEWVWVTCPSTTVNFTCQKKKLVGFLPVGNYITLDPLPAFGNHLGGRAGG